MEKRAIDTQIETCAEIVKRIQAREGLNDREMGDALGLTRQAVGYWRRGESEPSSEQIEKIVKEHAVGTWPFELASAFVESQYAAIRASIRARASGREHLRGGLDARPRRRAA